MSDSRKTRGRQALGSKGKKTKGIKSSKNNSEKRGKQSPRRIKNKQTKRYASQYQKTRGNDQRARTKANAMSNARNAKQHGQIQSRRWMGAAREVSIKRFLMMIAAAAVILILYVTPRLLYLEVIDFHRIHPIHLLYNMVNILQTIRHCCLLSFLIFQRETFL